MDASVLFKESLFETLYDDDDDDDGGFALSILVRCGGLRYIWPALPTR